MTTPTLAPPAVPARRVSLALDPLTHAELERAAGHRDVASYLCTLAGRYARWSELREWLTQIEAVYGPLPPEAVERVHRQMLGLPRRGDHPRTVSVAFSDSEFAALSRAAGDRPVAAYLRDLLADLLGPERTDPAGPRAAEPGAAADERAGDHPASADRGSPDGGSPGRPGTAG
ncbi:hypothetical protein ACFPZ0_24115 [Streptomonospora nanhaiensis]|uniref:Uncharacterized protein n=1 Tax=Streptomonospora nanhaiensis TaxID=1323731 RepID=A0A853BTV3_9ACTN|nr:hypothetical protein [Streptomonospora nanhaiensis]MBV2365475.1 hypothetical protein [Streptomonospora nanhaiensis]MBX9391163.1 hypothetical protein [Streptomonospora nanhaiensis]NYI98420.1 hypothetical protein [Streptomonospora nanhaiensis]